MKTEEKMFKDVKISDDIEDHHRDPLTEIIGKIGKFQLTWAFITAIPVIFHGWMMMSNKWVTYNIDHWCARPISDIDLEQWLNLSAPLLPGGSFDKCHVFDVNFSETLERPSEDTPKIPCSNWEYDTSLFSNTATERWDLVCNQKYLRRVIQMTFFAGNFVGVMVSGFIADKFGRKFGYLLFLTLWIVFGAGSSHVSNFFLWLLCRFMCGALSIGYYNALVVWMVEHTHGKWRSLLAHMFADAAYHLGILLLAALVYFNRDMVKLELIIGLANLPFLLLWFIMPKSPRWLLAKERKPEAKIAMNRICQWNKLPAVNVDEFVNSYTKEKIMTGRYFDLFEHPSIRRNTILMCFVWFSFSMGFYGLTYNTPSLDWNVFLVFAFPAIFNFSLQYFVPFIENRFGRKFMVTFPVVSAGILLVVTTLLPRGSQVIIVLAWIGTICCGIAFGSGYIYTKELYPTSVRTQAVSTASASARLGSIISPFIALLEDIHYLLPIVTYGAILFTAGFLSIWIWPETKKTRLPDTMEDTKILASGENTWTSWSKCK